VSPAAAAAVCVLAFGLVFDGFAALATVVVPPGPALLPGLYPRGQHRAGRADTRGNRGRRDGWVHDQLPSAVLRPLPELAAERHDREGAAREIW
jgi:hypothetical protein